MNTLLKTEYMTFPDNLLQKWRTGDYTMLTQSRASDFIKRILLFKKARRAPDQRFFGEAFIATNTGMINGYFNSYQWLTAAKWVNGKGLKPDLEMPFHKTLMEHFGKDAMTNLQQKAISLYHNEKAQLSKKPATPDLWIIDKNNHHRFIESKLPDDNISEKQLAGLALIKKYLGEIAPISVSLVCLYPENCKRPEQKDCSQEFLRFYELA